MYVCACVFKKKTNKEAESGAQSFQVGGIPLVWQICILARDTDVLHKKKSLEACDFTLNKQIKTM